MIMRLISCCVVLSLLAVTLAAQPALTPEQQKAQEALQEKAVQMLDQVVAEARSLKLPENRLRVLWQAGDLLWPRDETRARALFAQVAAGLSEVVHGQNVNDRRSLELLQAALQWRQEFLTTVARRDPKLAHELLLTTRPPLPPNASNVASLQNAEANLELTILAQLASSDPRLAFQNAEAALDKGQYPSSLTRLLAQLQEKDKDAATKLKDKLLKRLRTESLLTNTSASNVSLSLLRSGPRLAETKARPAASTTATRATNPALEEAAYRELLELVVAAALNATPRGTVPTPPSAPTPNPVAAAATPAVRNELANAQTAQNNARNLLNGLQAVLPQVEKYLPARAPQLRQKMTEAGLRANTIVMTPELNSLLQSGSAAALLQAAPTAASPETRNMLYRQAAFKAVNEGNAEQARQIATQHLDEKQREGVLREVERQETLQKALTGNLETAKGTLAAMKTDAERINWLTQAAALATKKNDPKLATQFLDDARVLLQRRADNYQQFDSPLRVARGYAEVDVPRAIEVLTPGIEHLNELLTAAAVLTGFELRVFKEGEMLLQGGGQMGNLVARYGQALATVARHDFDRAQSAADQFQRAEPRLLARMAMVRGILEVRTEE